MSAVEILVEPHPLLDLGVFLTRFAAPVAELIAPPELDQLVITPGSSAGAAGAPLEPSDEVKAAARALLRHGGFKPSGRSKPASEYLVGAVTEGRFPRINAAVDACNVVSLHSGLPISLVDLDRVELPLVIRISPVGTSYVFNPSGQTIDVGGLVCLWDAQGPTGTPVKDAQRTKTHEGTRATLSIVWGTTELPGRAATTTRWYRELVAAIPGASLENVQLRQLR